MRTAFNQNHLKNCVETARAFYADDIRGHINLWLNLRPMHDHREFFGFLTLDGNLPEYSSATVSISKKQDCFDISIVWYSSKTARNGKNKTIGVSIVQDSITHGSTSREEAEKILFDFVLENAAWNVFSDNLNKAPLYIDPDEFMASRSPEARQSEPR